MDNRDHFLSTNFSQAMAWQTLPPVPEQSMDSFFNPSYDHSVISSILKENIPNYVKPMPMVPISADPGFSERAARLSPFGSRSFNGRRSQMGLENIELGGLESNGVFGNLKLGRVSSAHSLRSDFTQTQVEFRPIIGSSTSPNEGSSVSQQFLETEEKFNSDSNFRKRKAVSKGKSQKVVVDEKDDRESKRCKTSENKEIESNKGEKEEEANTKAPEPLKDYIHVRARRGQATDSHSLAERVRREKISERMKLLQDLVPGCNKVTGKALMLDEIINYVQSLQCQVEFLSMKLASVDTFENSTGSLLPKDVTNSTYQIDSPSLFGQQNQEFHQPETNFSNEPMTNCSLDPSDTTLCSDIGLQLPFIDEFAQGFPQISGSYVDDLQSIVQMGFGNNPTMEL